MKLHLVDVTTAFLNCTLEKELFMKQPEGFEIKGKEGMVCKLKNSQNFELKNLGNLSYFLVISVTQDSEFGNFLIDQHAYIKRTLEVFGMQDCIPVATPISSNSKLIRGTDDDDCVDQTEYQSAIGSMMYLAVCTSPDIAIAVS